MSLFPLKAMRYWWFALKAPRELRVLLCFLLLITLILCLCIVNSVSSDITILFLPQISHKYSLIYVITKLGLLFVYDLETATAVYRNRISPDPIFLTAEASSVGGFYAINRRGQVLLATVNEATIISFVSGQVSLFSLHSAIMYFDNFCFWKCKYWMNPCKVSNFYPCCS